MQLVSRRRWYRWYALSAPLITLALLSACAAGTDTAGEASKSPTSSAAPVITSATVAAPAPTTQATRSKNWFDLDVGDCLADPPPVDPNVIAVRIVDCATTHRAEVYLRAPMAVNTALAAVADRECGAGFTNYTGQQVGDGPLALSYLIDSNQNRTSSNPDPSAVICVLTAADGRPLTGSARR